MQYVAMDFDWLVDWSKNVTFTIPHIHPQSLDYEVCSHGNHLHPPHLCIGWAAIEKNINESVVGELSQLPNAIQSDRL